MGASKNDQIEDSFFNAHYAEDGQHACGSFETEAAIRACYVPRKPNVPPPLPFVKFTQQEKERWDHLKLTEDEKDLIQDEYLKKHGI